MLKRVWDLLCSLKLAIYLASAATLLLMGGSLLIPFNPSIFGGMDHFVLGDWLKQVARPHLEMTWWMFLTGGLMILFGLNTLCCFADWFCHIRTRWRKSGEYLLHLGVFLVLTAYIWGGIAGWRLSDLPCPVGTSVPLPDWPGYSLRVDSFEPVFQRRGPPLDMISQVSILRGKQAVRQGTVKINQPLLQAGLVVVPVSFGRKATGFLAALPGSQTIEFRAGTKIQLADGARLEVLQFFPDASQRNGAVHLKNDQLGNPAFELKYTSATGTNWQGWYFLAGPPPAELSKLGIGLRFFQPLFTTYSILTVNFDPGAPLAAVGSGLMSIGVLLALGSFYRKRRRLDRPEII